MKAARRLSIRQLGVSFVPGVLALALGSAAGGVQLQPGDFVMYNSQGHPRDLVVFDGSSMAVSPIASGGMLTGAVDLSISGAGDILLAVPGMGVVRVASGSGEQSLFASPGTLGEGEPSGITVDPAGPIYVSMQGTAPRVIQLSPEGEFVRVVTSGGFLPRPAGMCFGSDGALVVCATSAYGGGGLVRVDVNSGAQTVLAANEPFRGPFDVALAPDGTLWSVQYGVMSQRHYGCVVRTREADGHSDVMAEFDCTAYGVAVRADGTALVADCYRINGDCGTAYSQLYPSGMRIEDYSGPVVAVPEIVTGSARRSWGRIKVLYR